MESHRATHFTANSHSAIYITRKREKPADPLSPTVCRTGRKHEQNIKGKNSRNIHTHAALKWPEALNLALWDV